MSRHHDPSLRPRNGHTLVVGVVARISGGPNQKDLSLDDQVDHAKDVVAELYDGPVEYRVISTKAKGERLDRPELEQIEAMLRSRELDLMIADDIGRMVRGTEAVRLCGIAVDHATRVIAPNDCIDTAEESWEEDVISACRDHVGHNAHTSKRLKQKLMNRFKKFGGATPREIYGYLKPEGSRTYDDWQKVAEATAIYPEWFLRLRADRNCSAVADWLNEKEVPPGKYCRRKKWDGAMVRRVTANTLLKGKPGRGHTRTVKHHETGRRVAVKNPQGAHYLEYPHLAHVEEDLFDEVNALLEGSNRGLGRPRVDGVDPRQGVPRKRTRFPGQHACCWYCGREYVWGGNGVTGNLMCNGSREWRCWNSVGFDGALAARAVAAAVAKELYRLEGFDDQFRGLVEQALRGGDSDPGRHRSELVRREAARAQQEANLMEAIANFGAKPALQQKLEELEATGVELARERRALERRERCRPDLPGSVAELRAQLEGRFAELAVGSPEFGTLMRAVAPEFHVYLVRLLDGGHLLARARVKLVLTGLFADAGRAPDVEALSTRVVTLDLFEPPQREQIREEAVRRAAAGQDQRLIARGLGVTQPAVSHALALDRLMRERGLSSPYELVPEPPTDYPKLRRHLNAKYRFEPVAGYDRPAL